MSLESIKAWQRKQAIRDLASRLHRFIHGEGGDLCDRCHIIANEIMTETNYETVERLLT